VVWGQRDAIVLRGCVKAYQQAIVGATAVELANAGHRPEIEDSAGFVRAVKAFLAA
jgi:pimeloyl-ACP methyl ester carboxylesterase